MKTYLSHNATKQLIITLLLGEKPDSRPSNSEVIHLIFLAPKLGISMQTQRSRASWLVHGQYCKGALPSSCWQGASPGPAASAPTPLPHRAFLTSTQPSIASPGPAPICLSQVYPLDRRGNTRWDSLLGLGEVPETCCSLTTGTRPPFQAGGTDLKRPHLRGEPLPASVSGKSGSRKKGQTAPAQRKAPTSLPRMLRDNP